MSNEIIMMQKQHQNEREMLNSKILRSENRRESRPFGHVLYPYFNIVQSERSYWIYRCAGMFCEQETLMTACHIFWS